MLEEISIGGEIGFGEIEASGVEFGDRPAVRADEDGLTEELIERLGMGSDVRENGMGRFPGAHVSGGNEVVVFDGMMIGESMGIGIHVSRGSSPVERGS